MLSESLLRRQIDQDVRVTYENLMTSGQRLRELQVQLTAAAEGFRQADQSFSVGLATNLERLTAQDQLLSAQLQLTSQQSIHKYLYLNLRRVIGQLTLTSPLAATQPTTQPATQPATQPVTQSATTPAM
jgi:outer membrane protein TolC